MTANYSSQQPRDYAPFLSEVAAVQTTWGTGGNTCTITDASIHPSSVVAVNATTQLPAGFWKYTVSQGSLIITSSDAENSALGLNYKIL